MNNTTLTVTSLNIKIKSLLETTFMHISVEGEVASVTYHNSGHLYFSIKDNDSVIKCVMFRSNARRMKFRLERGAQVVVHGSISVYAPRGEYQFLTVSIEPSGQGALALAYEQLKSKLEAQGYFDPRRKKPQPKYITKLALVTASKGAALQDMLTVIQKRWALLEVVVIDTLVQGEQAPEQIAKALHYADGLGCDAIVVGRGGGSREDLWAFNEEVVADALFGLKTFVVSAVGHEVDVVISDFVADLRAPTPSAAIEMIVPDQVELLYLLDELADRYRQTMHQIMRSKRDQLQALTHALKRQSLDRKMATFEHAFMQLQGEFDRVIAYRLSQFEARVTLLAPRLTDALSECVARKVERVRALEQKFKLHHPANQHRVGWAEVIKGGNRVALEQIEAGDHFTINDPTTSLQVKCLQKRPLLKPNA